MLYWACQTYCSFVMMKSVNLFCWTLLTLQEDFDDPSDWDNTEEPAHPPQRLEQYTFTSWFCIKVSVPASFLTLPPFLSGSFNLDCLCGGLKHHSQEHRQTVWSGVTNALSQLAVCVHVCTSLSLCYKKSKLGSNCILASCHPHRITSGQARMEV